jgi:transcriptional regulator with XRE-family HTH domain
VLAFRLCGGANVIKSYVRGFGLIFVLSIRAKESAMERLVASPEETTRLRKAAGDWLHQMREKAGLSQIELAERLGLKYCTFVAQVENGFGRIPLDGMEQWARALELSPHDFARRLLSYYDPNAYRMLFGEDANATAVRPCVAPAEAETVRSAGSVVAPRSSTTL